MIYPNTKYHRADLEKRGALNLVCLIALDEFVYIYFRKKFLWIE